MKRVMIEFPVVGYAEVFVEVEDGMSAEDILDAIREDEITITYDGHSHAETLYPLLDIDEAQSVDIPMQIGVVE